MQKFVVTLISVLFAGTTLQAQFRSEKQSAKPPFTIVDAYSQRTVPGVKGARPFETVFVIVRWRSRRQPGQFLFGDTSATSAQNATPMILTGAKQIGMHEVKGMGSVIDYKSTTIKPEEVKRGDTLMLVYHGTTASHIAVSEGKVYYELHNKKKGTVSVTAIARRKDLIAP